MAREGLDVGGTGRNKSDNREVGGGSGDRGNERSRGPTTRAKRKTKARTERAQLATRLATGGNGGSGRLFRESPGAIERSVSAIVPTGQNMGALQLLPGTTAGRVLNEIAEKFGLTRADPRTSKAGRPAEGRDAQTAALARRTRLRPLAGDAPVGTIPLTGAADEEAGAGSGVLRRRQTIIGAANVRRPVLSSAFGARFLGR